MPKRTNKGAELPDQKRRSLLKLSSYGVAALAYLRNVVVDGATYDGAKEFAQKLLVDARRSRDRDPYVVNQEASQNWGLIDSIFGPFRQVVISPAYDNPDVRGYRHDNDWRAAEPFAEAIRFYLGGADLLTPQNQDAIRRDIGKYEKVLLGGAISHPLARTALGYTGGGHHWKCEGKIPLRWTMCYESDKLQHRDEVMVYHSNSASLMSEPLWEIRDSETPKPLVPGKKIDQQGNRVLDSNWLLVTKLLEEGATPKPLILSAGCHGVGTASLSFVLADQKLLEQLQSAVVKYPQWQALYRVKRVLYDDAARVCYTTRDDLELEDFHGLNNDPVDVDWPTASFPS